MAQPGGNVTGLSQQATDLAESDWNCCAKLYPVSADWRSWSMPAIALPCWKWPRFSQRHGGFGLEAVPLEIRQADDITLAFEGLNGRADALYVVVDTLITANRTRIAAAALAARLPTIYDFREHVVLGGLMSYGPTSRTCSGAPPTIVDKILRGTKPAEIPVEQPTKFELVINLKTAKALGLKIPERCSLRADEVIE